MNERYELIAPIAEGGLGAIFKARDRQLGREVAIKRIRADKAGDLGAAVETLIREAMQQSLLQHPNIVAVYDAGVDDEGGFIVMEWVDGETLEEVIQRGALTLENFDSLVRQVMQGMVAAHEQGVIHLDLKPENLMIQRLSAERFQVKIIDFGLAKSANQPLQQDTAERGGLFGSIYFMAPEQFERAEVDIRTDIYALGCISYFALTQKYPFSGETMPQVMVAHLRHHTTPLSALRPDLPATLVQWVEWLMNRLPANRPSSMAKALQVYQNSVAETELGKPKEPASSRLASGRPIAATLPSQSARPVRSGLPKWTSLVLAFLIILIVGFVLKRYAERSRDAGRQRRFAQIAGSGKIQVTQQDISLLFDYLENPKSSSAAAQVLIQLGGADDINDKLIQHLASAKHSMARANLVKIIALREIKGAFAHILPLVHDADFNLRKAAWTSLGFITQGGDLASLLDQLRIVPDKEADFAEQAVVSAVEAQSDRNAAVAPIIAAYRSGKSKDAVRALLLRVLGRVGGGDSLSIIMAAVADSTVAVRKAALIAISHWPSCDPIPALVARLPQETDPACRLLLLTAATQLCTQSGELPQSELFAQAKRLHEFSKDVREKDQAIVAMSRITDSQAAAFFEALSVSEPQRKAQAVAISQAINDSLSRVAVVTDNMTISADKADYPKLGDMDLMAGILVNWFSVGDWASWQLQFDQPGRYQIAIHQACDSQREGLYEVVIAGKTFRASAVRTSSAQDFRTCIVGDVQITRSGIYRLRISALEVPEKQQLWRLKGIELIKK